MIGNYHKNVENNLVCLCKKCHNDVHNGNLEINGYIKTSEGDLLDYKILDKKDVDAKRNQRKKFTDEQIEVIKELKKQNSKITQKYAATHLKLNNQIDVSPGIIGKIWKGNYN